jgi:hypothetical protein
MESARSVRARLKRLRKNSINSPEASGHDFTGCGKTLVEASVLKGHDFSRADKAHRINRALAPEGCFSEISFKFRPFSASCKVVP